MTAGPKVSFDTSGKRADLILALANAPTPLSQAGNDILAGALTTYIAAMKDFPPLSRPSNSFVEIAFLVARLKIEGIGSEAIVDAIDQRLGVK